MLPLAWTCPQCAYRTTLRLDVCPNCHVPLVSPGGKRIARRTQRIPLRPAVLCEVNARFEAAVLDLSPLGAGLEHRDILRPGQRFLLRMVPNWTEGSLVLPSQVAWSCVHRMERRRDEGGFIFRSGIEFLNLTALAERELAGYLASLGGGRAAAVSVARPASLS